MNKKNSAILSIVLLIFFITLISAEVSISEATFCCEKTSSGATCINTQPGNCNSAFSSAPTSCESTSFCKLGTCYNPTEGNCIQNTPKSTCEQDGGVWHEEDINQVSQCQLGCCVISDQAAFVSKTRCSRLSSFVGVSAQYSTDVQDEFMCILLAQGSQMGACVYEEGPEVTCRMQSRVECGGEESYLGINQTQTSDKRFYAGTLCSASELGTDCEKQYTTQCSEGKVYWYDSCGNKENVYSSNSENSFNDGKIAEDDEVCSPVAGSTSCGNCDYLMGGLCAEEDNNFGESGVNHFCQATECRDRSGNTRKNGESWCVYDGKIGSGADTAGSRHFREICLNGEVVTEGCADYRGEVCIHDELDNGFAVAACRKNLWESCTAQAKKSDCVNSDVRDCVWYSSVYGLNFSGSTYQRNSQFNQQDGQSGFTRTPTTGNIIVGSGVGDAEYEVDMEVVDTTEDENESTDGLCVPAFPPGLKFWDSGSSAQTCAQASVTCTITYKETLDYDFSKEKEIVSGSECLEDEWAEQANQVCVAMGDCGGYINFKGKYTDDGYMWLNNTGGEQRLSPNSVNKINIMSAGNVIQIIGNAIFGLVGAVEPHSQAMQDMGRGVSDIQSGVGMFSQIIDIIGELSFNPTTREATRLARGITTAKTKTEGLKVLVNEKQGAYVAAMGASADAVSSGDPKLISKTEAAEKRALSNLQTAQNNLQTAQSDLRAKEAGLNATLNNRSRWRRAGDAGLGVLDAAIDGVAVAGIATTMSQLFGNSDRYKKSVEAAAFFGVFAGKSVANVIGPTGMGFEWASDGVGLSTAGKVVSGAVGIGVAYFAYIDAYEEITTETVTFECKPWQAPTRQNECGACSEDDLPCSEYRCKSLGPSCGVVNEGTDEELCIDMGLDDASSPTITPSEGELTDGYQYTNIGDYGFTIETVNGACIPSFTSIQWGIETDEPAQCKIDVRHTQSFEDMRYYIGGSNTYDDEHAEYLVVPNSRDLVNSSNVSGIVIQNGNEMELYIRCRDGNSNVNSGEGNVGEAEYAVKFCVDPTPDITPPQIISSSVESGSCVAADTESAEVIFYTNEPASCRWDRQDRSEFDDMQYAMTCSRSSQSDGARMVYPCSATLTSINRDNTSYYIKCQDDAGNDNDASYDFALRGSMPLKIMNLGPNETIRSGATPAEVNLQAETMFGCEAAVCFYSETGAEGDFTMFFDTDTDDGVHTQKLFLEDGQKTIYFKCVDAGGNVAENSTSFDVDIDTTAPEVVRVYEEAGLLKVVTFRDSTCAYSTESCNFLVDEGESLISPTGRNNIHVTEWVNDLNYFVKCRDEFNNEDIGCSVIVRPTDNFL